MGAVRLTTRRQSLLCLFHPIHPSTMQKALLLILLVAFVASTSAFHFGLGGIGYGLGYGYGYPYAMGGIGGYGLGGFYPPLGGYGLGYGLGYGFGGYNMFGKGYY